MTDLFAPDPRLDLVLDRVVDVPPDLVWEAWTDPEHMKQWFCPRPWQTVECELDLRPGGMIRFVMRSPEGQDFPNIGCYLEVTPKHRLVWTSALLPGFRPAPISGSVPFHFTAVISIEPHPKGTRYVATAIHADEAGTKQHAEMGFHDGWSTVLDQLVEVIKSDMKKRK